MICGQDAGAPYCVDALTDNLNCGACGNACGPQTPSCSNGVCSQLFTFQGIKQNLPVAALATFLLAGCSTPALTNLTPDTLPANPSQLYTLSTRFTLTSSSGFTTARRYAIASFTSRRS